jgi:hypothetical protein
MQEKQITWRRVSADIPFATPLIDQQGPRRTSSDIFTTRRRLGFFLLALPIPAIIFGTKARRIRAPREVELQEFVILLLTCLIEKISGESYEKFIQENILDSSE